MSFYHVLHKIVGFFDYQYLWKETINILDILHEGIYKRKLASKRSTVGWVCTATCRCAKTCQWLALVGLEAVI